MELDVINDLVIQCEKCGEIHIIDRNSLEIYTYTDERSMGTATEYDFVGESVCYNCGNRMCYTVKGYEYPVGCLNYEDYESEGCLFIQEPSVEVNYFEFEYTPYEEEYISNEVGRARINIERILVNNERIYDLTPRDFEGLVAEVFRENGFDVVLTQQTRDGGSDIIATYSLGGMPYLVLIECKKYSPNNKVGVSLVRSFLGVQMDQKANKGVIVTTSTFTRDARVFAERQNHLITLLDYNDLLDMMRNNRNR